MLKQTQHWNIARVLQETTLSKSTIYRLIQAGKFPAPTKISTRRVVWNESEIRVFLDGGL